MQFNCRKKLVETTSFIKKLPALLIVLALLMPPLLSGCSSERQNQSSPEQKQLSSEEGSDKIPEQLKDMEESIEKIISAMDGPAAGPEEEGKMAQGKDSQGKQQASEENRTSGKKEQESSGEKNKDQNEGQSQTQEQEKKAGDKVQEGRWEEITPIVNSMHYKWNSYMPSAVKMGANKKLIDDFSNALNSLTDTIISKNQTNTLLAASYLYAYIPDFYLLYKTNPSPEIKRIRYYTRNAMLNAMTANWTQAGNDINNLKSSWSLFKNTPDKEQQDHVTKLDFSIYELDKVIREKSQTLTDIKGRVAMANIDSLEKAMKEDKQGESGGRDEGEGGKGGQQGVSNSQ
jgi:hypothetical protein